MNERTEEKRSVMEKMGEEIKKAVGQINLGRLRILALVALPIHGAHILLYYRMQPGAVWEHNWRLAIMGLHGLLFVLMALYALLTSFWKEEDGGQRRGGAGLVYAGVSSILFLGIAVVTFDQLVTVSITPFVVVCVLIGATFLLPPPVAAAFYGLGYGLFFMGMGLFQNDGAALLSGRLNGLMAAGLGFFLSLVLWKNQMRLMRHREQIPKKQKELEKKNRHLLFLASRDPLTGMYNRRYFEQQMGCDKPEPVEPKGRQGPPGTGRLAGLAAADARADQKVGTPGPGSLILLDLDNFKTINDSFGHPAGDEVLRQFGRLLHRHWPEPARIARWGGEEFVVFLPETDAGVAIQQTEKLRRILAQQGLVVDHQVIDVTVSAGIAHAPGRSLIFSELYHQADRALYQAKSGGRNRVLAYGSDGECPA